MLCTKVTDAVFDYSRMPRCYRPAESSEANLSDWLGWPVDRTDEVMELGGFVEGLHG